MDSKIINTSITFAAHGTKIRFSFEPEEEDGKMEFFVERRDKNGDNGEEEINYVLATFTLDEAEYIARRMLDAVAFQRKLECPAGIPAGPEVVPFEEYIPSPEEKERLTLLNVLEKHNWDRDKAAHELGISARTLYRKIAQYGLK